VLAGSPALGRETIPAEVRELSADEAHWISLVENMQRADLSPIEEARAYQEWLSQGLTQAKLAKRIGKDRSYIAQKHRLLILPAPRCGS
jgi:ParB family transcriptional regulator, chromosome partitioning protein